ncbi:hypothetical protein T11_6971 [Trichinella zimbabwensis]|uniref:Reverse transcriptase domain-containing protein n=1 Tax=Trichinella zimbabwensis TaxID=268475 RepID=A0A0V1HRY8_9BILA|nr:hypothetical protein T11_6971 [Trichinella zimbabwensis]
MNITYCCIITNEVDHGTVLMQEFRNFNSLEGLGITDKSSELSRRETEDLEHIFERWKVSNPDALEIATRSAFVSRTGKCNGPLPRAGSSASSTRLLARPSLFGDGPVLTGAFPFLSVSRFPDGIATIKQQTMSIYFIKQSETRIDDDVTTNTRLWPLANARVYNHYRTPPPIFMSYSSYGKISLARSMSAALASDDEAKCYIRRLSPMEAADLRKHRHWFLLHCAVFHPDKPDKSARNGGVSLNSLFNTGQNLITSLLGVLVRFRCGRIAVKADVKRIFSQVAVTPADSDMLAFLWTSSVDREPDVYANQRHVFSAACSPALANFTLREAVKRKDMAIAQIVNEAFYMDDLYWIDDNDDESLRELKSGLREACFELSKCYQETLPRVNSVYAKKQELVAQYTGEYINGRRNHLVLRAGLVGSTEVEPRK